MNRRFVFFFFIGTLYSSFAQNGLLPIKEVDVEALNAGPLSPEQIDTIDNLNYLLSHPEQSTLSQVYSNWQQLKNSLSTNNRVSRLYLLKAISKIQEIISDWERRRDELLKPVLDQLEEIVKNTDNPQDLQIFDEFRDAAMSLSSGENIPNITLIQYTVLQEQAFENLDNYSDIYMNVFSNLSTEFLNASFMIIFAHFIITILLISDDETLENF